MKNFHLILLFALIGWIPTGELRDQQNDNFDIFNFQNDFLFHWNKNDYRNRHLPIVTKYNYESFWYKSTFPTKKASIAYHTKKHGHGRTPLQYTKDAVYFYEKNKDLRIPIILKDGTPGYKIKKGKKGGTWTRTGKIVTFWG
jgi:hypothetical protein